MQNRDTKNNNNKNKKNKNRGQILTHAASRMSNNRKKLKFGKYKRNQNIMMACTGNSTCGCMGMLWLYLNSISSSFHIKK